MNNSKTYQKRADVPVEYTWDLSDLYKNIDDWKKDFDILTEAIPVLDSYKGTLSGSQTELLEFFEFQDRLTLLIHRFYNYAARKADEDTSNTTFQSYKDQASSLMVKISSACSFAEPELLAISDETLDAFYEAEPKLLVYKRYIDDIRRKKSHILSNDEERILAAAGEIASAPGDIYVLLNNADLTFPSVTDIEGNRLPVTHASFITLMSNYDRNVRKDAFDSMYKTYDHHKNVSAAMLSAQMKRLCFFAKMRHYDSPLEAALDETGVDPAVYHNLIDTVHKNMDLMYRYVNLRKKLLKYDDLHMYDMYVPVVPNASRDIPFNEAKENILNALSVLGDDYTAIIKKGFEKRWIDVYENTGKKSGAYSTGGNLPHPYILLNYKNSLESEFTVAHEMGHAIHSYLSNKRQPVIDSDYKIFVAEVASTCNEALLMQYLLKNTANQKERAFLINYFLEQFRTTLYRQTMFAEFELKMSELALKGESINAQTAGSVYHDLIDLYFGSGIVHDKRIDLEWARIPHFYYNFYVYQYATGFSAAIALSQKILTEGESAVSAYKNRFLSAGCSKDPVSILMDAGVDMSSPRPIQNALNLFKDLLNEMEGIL